MNWALAVRFNAGAEDRVWTREELPVRFQRVLPPSEKGAQAATPPWAPTLLDAAMDAVTRGEVRSIPAALFAQEVALFQRLHGLHPDGCLGPETFRVMQAAAFLSTPKVPFHGKGLWIWNESHLPADHVEMAVRADVRHVLIKVADHGAVHPSDLAPSEARSRLRALFRAYRKAGITPIPWVYAGAYETDERDNPTRLLREVRQHVDLARDLDAQGFVVNAEKGFKDRYTKRGQVVRLRYHREHAARYMAGLHAELAIPIGLSSYHFATGHRNFAWDELVAGADFLMPQCYWSLKSRTNNNPYRAVHDAAAEWDEYSAQFGRGRPIVPSGGMYQTKRSDRRWPDEWHRPEDITAMVRTMDELLVPGCTFWWYVEPRNTKSGSSRVTTAQWTAFAAAAWLQWRTS